MEENHTLVDGEEQATQLMSIKGGIDISDPLKPYLGKHKYQYDCSYLNHPLLHKDYAKSIAYAIALRLSKLKPSKRQSKHPQFNEIAKFLIWTLDYLTRVDKPFTQSVKASLAAGEMPDRGAWQLVINRVREKAISARNNPFCEGNKASRNSFLLNINSFLQVCWARGVFPRSVLNGIKYGHLDGGRLKILGDLPSHALTMKDAERLIGGFLQDRVNEHDIIEEEREACIKSLVSSGLNITGMTDVQIMEEVKRLNTERLKELRRCAETDFIKGWEAFQEGQQLLEECDLSYEEDMRGLIKDWSEVCQKDSRGKRLETRQHPFSEMFFGSCMRKEVTANGPVRSFSRSHLAYQPLPERMALSRLLTLLDGRYGLCPKLRRARSLESIVEEPVLRIWRHMFINYKRNDFEGWPKDRLGPSLYTLLMAQIILLIDTGLNVEVVDELTVDCVKDTDIPTIKEVWGIKSRAGYKAVCGQVRLNAPNHKINSIEVIERVKEMTRRFRGLAKHGHPLYKVNLDDPRIEERLFIREKIFNVPFGEVTITAGVVAVYQKSLMRFKHNHPTVGAYKFQPSSIRPTVRVLAFMNGEGIETSSAEMGHASIATTTGYVMRTMTRIEMEERIREFMKHYETIIIQDIPCAAEKLGYTLDEYEERLKVAQRTGLGTICDHLRKDSEGNEYSLKQKDCDPVEECPKCPLARVFPALKENLVDAFLMRRWIRDNETELRENEERWREVWMRWLAIVEGVIDKAKTAHNVSRKTIREAEEMAEGLFGSAGFLSLV